MLMQLPRHCTDCQITEPGLQAAVLGMSCRLDVVEMLEKRVRSRFSHTTHLVLEPPEPPLNPVGSPSAAAALPADQPSSSTGPGAALTSTHSEKWKYNQSTSKARAPVL